MSDSKKNEILYVGIDLGTSQSSISPSQGDRHVARSYVGWPVDMVARKVIKKKVLIGDEAVEYRSLLDLHRPLEHGLLKEGSGKDVSAVRELLDYLIDVAGGHKKGRKVRAVVGVPAEAMLVSRQELRTAVAGLVDSMLLVSEPFAVAYGLDALLHTMVIDIGAGTTDFCVMRGRYPTEEDQRTLPNAGDTVDSRLSTLVAEKYPDVQFSIHMVREWKEKYAFVGNPTKKVKVTVPEKGRPTEIDITREMQRACESIVPPIVETMLELIAKIEPEFQEQVRKNIILSGCTALTDGLAEALEAALEPVGGGTVRRVEDPIYAGSDGGLLIAQEAPESDWEKLTTA
jgi:rod shape-determining protein MreB